MTEQDKHRRNFWIARFTEFLHSDAEKNQPNDDRKARNCTRFADLCLEQYDITFQTEKEQ